MGMLRAADFRVQIGTTYYAVQEVMVGASVQPINVSNTEGKPGNAGSPSARGFTSRLPDLSEGRIRLVSATFSDTENPYKVPLSIRPGAYFAVKVEPGGNAAAEKYDYGNCLCISCEHMGRIPGAQPVTIEFETDGGFILPALPPA